MNEISCRQMRGYLYYFRNYTKIPLDDFVGDLPYSLEYLENPRNWIDWDSFRKFIKKLHTYYPTSEDIINFGIDINQKAGIYHPIAKLIGLVISPVSLYKLGWKWVAAGMIKTMAFNYAWVDQHHLRMISELAPQYEGDPYLGYITIGLLINYPSFLGLPDTTVEVVEVTGRRLEVIVALPPSLTLWARLRRIVTALKTTPVALRELDSQQEQIRESEERFRSLAQSAADAIITLDEKGQIQYWNPTTEKMFGLKGSSLNKANLADLLLDWTPQFMQKSEKLDRVNLLEYQGVKSDGQPIPAEVSFSRWYIQGKVHFTAIIRDISRRKNTENHLRQSRAQYRKLTQKLLSVQDEERERISREIHDSLGEYLSTLILRCEIVKKAVKKDVPQALKELDTVKGLLSEAIDECHQLSFELSPVTISKLGFVPAIREIIDRFFERSKLTVTFKESLNAKQLTNQQELTLFRIIQEGLNNIYKHAMARKVTINLSEKNGYLRLLIADDGRGFSLEETMQHEPDSQKILGGLGLLSIRERVVVLNGNLEIISAIGKGTTIDITIPTRKI